METPGEEEQKDEFYQVERIVNHKMVRGKKFFQVKWVGYNDKDNTWEPEENLANVSYMIEDYENKKRLRGLANDKRQGTILILNI